MTATEGILWYDTPGSSYIKLEYSANLTDSPLTYTEVSDLKAMSRNPEASPEANFTHYSSTEEELKLGLPRHGSFDAVCNFAPKSTSQAAVIGLNASKAERWWRITYPKAVAASTQKATEKFRAYVQSAAIAPPGAQDSAPVDLNFTLRVAGDYSFTPES